MDFKVLRIDGDKPQYKVIGEIDGESYVAGIFLDEKIADRISWLCDMITSDWCYARNMLNSEYVKRNMDKAIEAGAKEDFVKSTALNLYDWLNNNFRTEYSGEDSEGVSYNRIVKKGEV